MRAWVLNDNYLDVLLQILRTLERFTAEVAFVRLERNVNSDMRCDVIALDGCCSTRVPTTGQVEVVCTLATDVFLADVLEKCFS